MPHTKGKWEIRDPDSIGKNFIAIREKSTNYLMAKIVLAKYGATKAYFANDNKQRMARARRIVKCVNGYDGLVEALKEINQYVFVSSMMSAGTANQILKIISDALEEAGNDI